MQNCSSVTPTAQAMHSAVSSLQQLWLELDAAEAAGFLQYAPDLPWSITHPLW
jgi:hypothetical protein